MNVVLQRNTGAARGSWTNVDCEDLASLVNYKM